MSCEGPSMSDFDRGFCTDQSLSLSAVSAEGFLRPGKGVVLEYSESNPCLNYSTSLLSPLVALNKNVLSPGNTLSSVLSSPVEGKSSTPYERVRVQKPVLASSLDLSCVDLTTTHPSWEVSLIKAIVESPKSCLESSWSPINPPAPPGDLAAVVRSFRGAPALVEGDGLAGICSSSGSPRSPRGTGHFQLGHLMDTLF